MVVLPSWGQKQGSLGFQLGSAVSCPPPWHIHSNEIPREGRWGGRRVVKERHKLETVSSLEGLLPWRRSLQKTLVGLSSCTSREGARNPGCILDSPRDHLKTLLPALPQTRWISTSSGGGQLQYLFQLLGHFKVLPVRLESSCSRGKPGAPASLVLRKQKQVFSTASLKCGTTRGLLSPRSLCILAPALTEGARCSVVEAEPRGSFPCRGRRERGSAGSAA